MFPYTLWWQLSLRTWEMLLASAQVIGLRSARIAQAGASPNARDRREFSRMVSEKGQAAQRSALAMMTQLPGTWTQSWLRTWQAGLMPVHRAATANSRRLTKIEVRRAGRGARRR